MHDERIRIVITMTTPACPLHAYVTAQIEEVIRERFPDLQAVDVDLVWEPPWQPEMMSPALRRTLGLAG
jgi:metal-sulfur cluster biosynthetic enzyme